MVQYCIHSANHAHFSHQISDVTGRSRLCVTAKTQHIPNPSCRICRIFILSPEFFDFTLFSFRTQYDTGLSEAIPILTSITILQQQPPIETVYNLHNHAFLQYCANFLCPHRGCLVPILGMGVPSPVRWCVFHTSRHTLGLRRGGRVLPGKHHHTLGDRKNEL